MIILHFSLKEEYIIEHTNWKVSSNDIFNMQEEDILVHTNIKC